MSPLIDLVGPFCRLLSTCWWKFAGLEYVSSSAPPLDGNLSLTCNADPHNVRILLDLSTNCPGLFMHWGLSGGVYILVEWQTVALHCDTVEEEGN